MSAQWPLVVNRLVELLPTLPGWEGFVVIDGPMLLSEPPANYATIAATRAGESGTYRTEQSSDGFSSRETGTVYGELVAELDATGLADARAVLQAPLDGLDAAIRADRRLGVLSQEGTASLAVQLGPVLNAEGRSMLARFVLTYLTVT